nr:cation transporter [Pseudomonas resinovorans]
MEQRVLKRSIGMTLFIASMGVFFGLWSGSIAIIFDGFFSAVDASTSLLSLLVVRLLMAEGSRRFQYGYWHIEPMVLALSGSITMLLCLYAFFNALTTFMAGGHKPDLDWAIVYTVLISCIAFGMFLYLRRVNRRLNSGFLNLDSRSWLMSALIAFSLLIAFGVAWLMTGTRFEHLTPYVDSVTLMVLSLCLLVVPGKIVFQAIKEVFLVSPDDLSQQVQDVMTATVARHQLASYNSYVAKVGRALFIEIIIIVPPDFRLDGIATLDAIREEIRKALGDAGPERWLTIAFTGDRRWL